MLTDFAGSFYQLMYTFGIFTAYWVDYAVANRMGPVTRQWQLPIGLQIAPAALLGFGMLTVSESVRWLAQKGRDDDAWESLKWIRADDSEETRAELEEIQASIAEEQAARSGFQYNELMERDNFKRLAIGVTVFLCQQSVGATALVRRPSHTLRNKYSHLTRGMRRLIMARNSLNSSLVPALRISSSPPSSARSRL
jgi:hypothetical protein